MKNILHFAHGNGFPSPCYQQMLQFLQKEYDLCFIDKVGHSDAFPVTENWHYLVDEVIASIKKQSSQPVIALGHSLGGVLSFRAAVKEPELFRAVILLDSPIIGRFKSRLVRISKTLGMIDRITPAFRTRGRREKWDSEEELLNYLKSRKLFSTFAPECLQDYIHYGLEKIGDEYKLRFNRDIEYHIYRTIPHMLHEYEGKLTVPAALIYGNKSKVIDALDIRYMKKQHKMQCYKIAGTHMFPMETPGETASLISNVIASLLERTQ